MIWRTINQKNLVSQIKSDCLYFHRIAGSIRTIGTPSNNHTRLNGFAGGSGSGSGKAGAGPPTTNRVSVVRIENGSLKSKRSGDAWTTQDGVQLKPLTKTVRIQEPVANGTISNHY